MAYTQAGLAIGHEKFGKPTRFIDVYGLPAGRQSLSDSSLQEQYRVVRTLDPGRANGGVGNLNEGVELVKKKDSGKGQLCVLKRIRVKPKHSAMPEKGDRDPARAKAPQHRRLHRWIYPGELQRTGSPGAGVLRPWQSPRLDHSLCRTQQRR